MASANGKSRGKGRKGSWSDDYQFAEIKLSKDQKTDFSNWCSEYADDAMSYLDKIVQGDIKASISWSDAQECYTFSLTDNGENSPNYHVVMVSRSDTVWEALLIGLYKVIVICSDGRWPVSREESNWG